MIRSSHTTSIASSPSEWQGTCLKLRQLSSVSNNLGGYQVISGAKMQPKNLSPKSYARAVSRVNRSREMFISEQYLPHLAPFIIRKPSTNGELCIFRLGCELVLQTSVQSTFLRIICIFYCFDRNFLLVLDSMSASIRLLATSTSSWLNC